MFDGKAILIFCVVVSSLYFIKYKQCQILYAVQNGKYHIRVQTLISSSCEYFMLHGRRCNLSPTSLSIVTKNRSFSDMV